MAASNLPKYEEKEKERIFIQKTAIGLTLVSLVGVRDENFFKAGKE